MLFGKRSGGARWIIVFLGNPGDKYKNTRHNVGFLTGDIVASGLGIKIDRLKFRSKTRTAAFGEIGVLLMKPQTYMNLSGGALREAMSFYKVPLERVIAVSDDVSLPVGKVRVRREGSAGGHNGLRDIIEKCGGEGFKRVKIGVGPPPHPEYEMADWVLSDFTARERDIIDDAAKNAARAVRDIVELGVEYAMNRWN